MKSKLNEILPFKWLFKTKWNLWILLLGLMLLVQFISVQRKPEGTTRKVLKERGGIKAERMRVLGEPIATSNERTETLAERFIAKLKPSKQATPKQNDFNLNLMHTMVHDGRLNPCESCFVHNFQYLIINKDVCKIAPETSILLFIAITSTTKDVKFRDAIRKTWISSLGKNTGTVRYSFFLANSNPHDEADILEESQIHGDIIMEDFVDHYKNLTYKTVMAWKYFSSYCSHVPYFLKLDQDMWVNTENLINFLNAKTTAKKLNNSIAGKCYTSALVVRMKRDKYYMSYNEYGYSTYPPYCPGSYIMSSSMVANMYSVSKNVPFFRFEDVYSGLCALFVGYSVTNILGFHNGNTPLNICDYKNKKTMIFHPVDPQRLLQIWSTNCNK